jgi:hypothetical protein
VKPSELTAELRRDLLRYLRRNVRGAGAAQSASWSRGPRLGPHRPAGRRAEGKARSIPFPPLRAPGLAEPAFRRIKDGVPQRVNATGLPGPYSLGVSGADSVLFRWTRFQGA